MQSKVKSNKKDKLSQKDFKELYDYLKSVLNINKTLSSAFMGITLTAFIFLISLGYPDILDIGLLIEGTSIKTISLSLNILVLSFFFFLISTFFIYYSELKLNRFYLYWDSKLTLSDRFEKTEKLYKVQYFFVKLFFYSGVTFLIIAVFFIFFTFSTGGIIITIIILSILVFGIISIFLYLNMKEIFIKKKESQKLKIEIKNN